MKFRLKAEMVYEVKAPSTFLFNIHALKSKSQHILSETFDTEPKAQAVELYSPGIENRFFRLSVKGIGNLTVRYEAEADTYFNQRTIQTDSEIFIADLDASIHPYLYPSRYCQSDKLYRFAQHTFGAIKGAFAKAAAVTNWIFDNVKYTGGFTTSQTSAYDTVTELVGVCRDFAHLGIALCRALSIPARYFTAYAVDLKPGDFHACFEAYLDKEWVLFDPTRLVPLNGIVKIGTGRDAADTSVATMYGDVVFMSMKVSCEVLERSFIPLPTASLKDQLISYS